jgi:transglutaminase-like putative cysteine protease
MHASTAKVPSTNVARIAVVVLVAVLLGCGRAKEATVDSAPVSSGSTRQPDTTSALRLQTPRTPNLAHVDPAAFAAALGGDPARIFAFVRDSIAFESYSGVLRGPRGTLLAMAGNAADHASLLAVMLQAAGQHVRFARGTIDDRQARSLVDRIWASSGSSAEVAGSSAPLGSALEGMAPGIVRDFTLVRDQLARAGTASRVPGPNIESLIAESRQHFWIQWNQNGGWTDLDATFLDAAPGRAYARADETFDAIPASFAHRVRLRLRVEETTGGVSTTREVLQHETTASALASRDVVLGHMPEKWSGPRRGVEGGVSAALEDTGRVKPVLLLGADVVFGQPFLDREKTTGIGGIGGMLGGRRPHATAEWLDVEFIAPSGTIVQTSREIFDRTGPARRAAAQPLSDAEIRELSEKGQMPDVRGSILSLLFATGRIHAQHLLNLSADRVSSGDVLANARQLTIAFAALADAICVQFRGSDGTVIRFYPDTPRLFIAEVASHPSRPRIVLDLRHNQQRAVGIGPRGTEVYLAQVLRGVISGHLERTLTDSITKTARSQTAAPGAMSTSLVFDRLAEEKVGVLLAPDDRARLDASEVPDGRARLDIAIGRSQLVIVPARAISIDHRPRLAWWQVDPRSGETIAVTDEGFHQTSFEITVQREEGSTNVHVTVRQFLGHDAVTQVTPVQTVTYDAGVNQGFTELWRDINILLKAGGNMSVENMLRLPTTVLW